MKENVFQTKVIFVGDSGVGKTSIINNLVNKSFDINNPSTYGVDFSLHKASLGQLNIHMKVWDPSGQQKFRSVAVSYFKNKQGVFVVFDLWDEQSFKNCKFWARQVMNHANQNMALILLGNKADMEGTKRVSEQSIKDFCSEFSCKSFEVSAKTGANIQDAIDQMNELLVSKFGSQSAKILAFKRTETPSQGNYQGCRCAIF